MNKTIITVNIDGEPQKVELLFGMWALFRLRDFGFSLADLNNFNTDPLKGLEFLIMLLYVAACNAKGKDLEAYEKDVFYEHVDQNGAMSFFNGEEAQKVMKCFTNSLGINEQSGEKKSTTKRK